MIRTTLGAVQRIFDSRVRGNKINLPKTANKGLPGQFLETLLGIPTSSACLDCSDGEVKLFPMKKLKKSEGEFVPKETISITIRGIHTPEPIAWEDSDLKKKLSHVLFISYYREDDFITYVDSFIFRLDQASDDLCNCLKEDYYKITSYYRIYGVNQTALRDTEHHSTTITGKYIQGRTKGEGGGKKKVGFYFKKNFISEVLLRGTQRGTQFPLPLLQECAANKCGEEKGENNGEEKGEDKLEEDCEDKLEENCEENCEEKCEEKSEEKCDKKLYENEMF